MGAGESVHWLIGAAQRGGLGDASESDCTPTMEVAEAWETVSEYLGIDASALRDAIARVFGLTVADFTTLEPEALKLLPFRAARGLNVLPLRSTDRNLVVATSDPLNVDLEKEIAFLSGRRTIFEVAAPDAIRSAIASSWGSGPHQPALRLAELGESSELDGAASPDADDGSKRHILVVDDDPVGRLLIRTALEQRGFEVSEADDGGTAQPLLDSSTHIDLMLLDLMMEHVDGKTVLLALRQDERRTELPVVILTGSENPDDERELLRIGADDYLRKPVDPEQLIQRIEATLKRTDARAG